LAWLRIRISRGSCTTTIVTENATYYGSQLRLLYVEVLYTIKHKVGSTSGSYLSAQSDLFEYARRAFRLSDAEHSQLLTQASEEKVSRFPFQRILSEYVFNKQQQLLEPVERCRLRLHRSAPPSRSL